MHIYLLSLHWILFAKDLQTSPSQCFQLISTSPSSLKEKTVRNAEGTFHLPNYSCNWLLIVYLHPKSMFGSSTIRTLWKRKRSIYSRYQHYLWYRTDVQIVIRVSKLWKHSRKCKSCNKNIKDYSYSVSTMAWTTMAKYDLILWAKPRVIFEAKMVRFLYWGSLQGWLLWGDTRSCPQCQTEAAPGGSSRVLPELWHWWHLCHNMFKER